MVLRQERHDLHPCPLGPIHSPNHLRVAPLSPGPDEEKFDGSVLECGADHFIERGIGDRLPVQHESTGIGELEHQLLPSAAPPP